MKRVLLITLSSLVLVTSGFLIVMRFHVLPDESYPTWEAVRNILLRDGEIVITLPHDLKVVSARGEGRVSVNGQTVTTKIGYSWSVITIKAEVAGEPRVLCFNPQKPNNWNRIHFVPANPDDPLSDFMKFENGVEKPHNDVTRPQVAETWENKGG